MSSTEEQVRVLLDLARLSPSQAEFEQLASQYPIVRASVERLWALDLGSAQPSMVYRAAEPTGPKEVCS
jgi:Asp-tRNA(Asn)/Glu-tRNA(Gln) amidotransferase C subunit